MKKYKTRPQGYMTVGEVAKRMDVTIRTLQYYDKEGLLSPSSESEGGHRLYSDKDLIKLHQILSMKFLGFSLNDIKKHLISLDTPAEVANALAKHAAAIREKRESLSETLKALETLKEEVVQMQSVDFKKYADIVVNLQMKNEYYWLIKHFDEKTLDYIRSRFDKESGQAMVEKFNYLQNRAIQLQQDGVSPESEKGQFFAKVFWDMVMEFTEGDMSMLPNLMKMENFGAPNNEWKEKQAIANAFIEPALGFYFAKLGINPFGEATK